MPEIFVVEDDASLRDELKRLLDLQGYSCLATTDFEHAAEEILAARPDCVVLDLKLPGGGGHAVCRDVRRESAVPIIMLTSSDSEFDEVMSMNLGADDYVTKPYRPAVLLARIEAVLRRAAPFIDDNTLTVNVNRLRKSLAGIGVPDGFLATRRGQGYLV